MDTLISDTKAKMRKVLEVLNGDLSTIRTGRATPSLVENIVISAYGGTARLRVLELATINAQDSHTLVITPFDPSIINDIQKGILEANVGMSPGVDGQILRIVIPPLSQERRQQLIALMKQKLENGKVMIRQVRHDSMTEVKKMKDVSEDQVTHLEKEVQKVTDEAIGQIEDMGKKKEEELMQI